MDFDTDALQEALEKLHSRDREVIFLRYYEEKSLQETAEAVGISVEAVEKRVSRAVAKLRNFLTQPNGNALLPGAALASFLAFDAMHPAAASCLSRAVQAGREASSGTWPLIPASQMMKETLYQMKIAQLKLAVSVSASIFLLLGAGAALVHAKNPKLNISNKTNKMASLTPPAKTGTPLIPAWPGNLHIHYEITYTTPRLSKTIAEAAIRDIRKQGVLSDNDNYEIKNWKSQETTQHSRKETDEYWEKGENLFRWNNYIPYDNHLYHIPDSTSFVTVNGKRVFVQPQNPLLSSMEMGVWLEGCPLLGFRQPFRSQYVPGSRCKTISTSQGIIQTYQVRHAYRNELTNCVEAFDRQGRLLSLKTDDEWFNFGNFQRLPNGVWIPRDITWRHGIWHETFAGKVYTWPTNIIYIKAAAIDTISVSPAVFQP